MRKPKSSNKPAEDRRIYACESEVKIRLQGLPLDVEQIAEELRRYMTVLEESDNYPNRGDSRFVRRYMTVRV